MSSRIRALRGQSHNQLTPEQLQQLHFMATGQPLTPDQGQGVASIDEYLTGPSMASILLKQAKGEYARDLIQQAREAGTEGSVGPMMASILQLDRQ